METEILVDKIGELESVFTGLYMQYAMCLEQITLDLLEDIDSDLEELYHNPYNLELELEGIKDKARKLDRKFLEASDLELLEKIEMIDYYEL